MAQVGRIAIAATGLALAAILSGCSATGAPAASDRPGKSNAASAPADQSTPSPAITASADGTCNTIEASWSPMLSTTGVAILTYVSGQLAATVTTASGPVTKSVTVGLNQVPHSIEFQGIDPAAVVDVELTSEDLPASTCAVTREPGS